MAAAAFAALEVEEPMFFEVIWGVTEFALLIPYLTLGIIDLT